MTLSQYVPPELVGSCRGGGGGYPRITYHRQAAPHMLHHNGRDRGRSLLSGGGSGGGGGYPRITSLGGGGSLLSGGGLSDYTGSGSTFYRSFTASQSDQLVTGEPRETGKCLLTR